MLRFPEHWPHRAHQQHLGLSVVSVGVVPQIFLNDWFLLEDALGRRGNEFPDVPDGPLTLRCHSAEVQVKAHKTRENRGGDEMEGKACLCPTAASAGWNGDQPVSTVTSRISLGQALWKHVSLHDKA